MFVKPQEEFTQSQAPSTWEYLCKQEFRLRRKLFLSRLLPPVGTVIFLFNLLMATMNFLDWLCPEALRKYYEVIPVLPKLAAPLAGFQTGWGSMILFVVWFCFLLPLGVCALIFGARLLWDRFKKPFRPEALVGTEAHCAKVLSYKAERVYVLRRDFLRWSIFAEAAIAAALIVVTALVACLRIAADGSALELAAGLFILLLSVFVLYWAYVGLFQLFSLLMQLFYLAPSPWKYWELFHRIDAYWESVDPAEHAKRERIDQARRDRRWWAVFRKNRSSAN